MLLILLQILSVPAIIIGFVAFIGLVLQKKPIENIITGTFKTMLGFLILSGGATILVSSLNPFGSMFQNAFNIQGTIPNNEAIVAIALKSYATVTSLIMVLGMLVNIAIARFTPIKFIFLTGHHTFYMAALIAVILVTNNFSNTAVVLLGSLILGLAMSLLPALSYTFMQKITSGAGIAMGHFNIIGYTLSALVGKLFSKNAKSTEEMQLPKSINFLRDSSVAIALTMLILYIIVALFTTKGYVENNLSNGQNVIIFSTLQALTFAAGIYIILQGVRLLLAEIVPAFVGFSNYIVPNAKMALDCPIVFNYAPNAVMIGFVFSFLGGLVGLALLGALSLTLILPGVVPHFFTGATAGVFGNSTGGKKGAMAGAFTNGLLITFLPVVLLPLLGNLGFENTTFSDSDFGVIGIITSYIISIFN